MSGAQRLLLLTVVALVSTLHVWAADDAPAADTSVKDTQEQTDTNNRGARVLDPPQEVYDPELDTTQNLTPLQDTLQQFYRQARHFSTFDVCADSLCDQLVRQANGLARIKMVRKYIMDTVTMMDSLVTALDAELVVAGETMTRALGNRCRTAHAVLSDVIKGPRDPDRLNSKDSPFIYGSRINYTY
ncbi:uncharacterized protein LOC121861043 [Homarus americanus]|uniref:uncharacterized protein LOC121861043 n=1 Tax=Homarus americanus TaxID=6706 RepID=UPI001C483CFC|nr:uncharacterized protein LOC121861043 [Homarus americanus]XP_042214465.1 uncharacterized protein LOC121861043 [Homarus americanus]